jgi:hypothetical protein
MRKTVIIEGRNLLRQYADLKAKGYKTVWTGNGRICMEPAGIVPVPVVVVVTEVKGVRERVA